MLIYSFLGIIGLIGCFIENVHAISKTANLTIIYLAHNVLEGPCSPRASVVLTVIAVTVIIIMALTMAT